jgi:hypothetical protein
VQNTARRAEYDAIDVFANVEEENERQSENEESSPLLPSNLILKRGSYEIFRVHFSSLINAFFVLIFGAKSTLIVILSTTILPSSHDEKTAKSTKVIN